MGSMEPTTTVPADSSSVQETELSVEVGRPIAFAVALLAGFLSGGLAIAIAAGWHPL
ncbi:MAG: hypothetical protein QOD60_2636 [Solirubrobacterales bacterium]|jgi:hypothetical protein|nr:hypothetical protein [Solirubrobacterales bacterium]